MAEVVEIVCTSCDAVNRVPAARLASDAGKAVCGRCKAKLFAGKPVALDDEARFLRHIEKSGIPVLVDFWAPWCGPCLMMAPAFEQAAAKLEPRARLAKVDTQAVPALGARYGVQAIPTMILFRQGREVARQSGAMQLPGILRFAEPHLGVAA
jgi:thioredoxin 2